MNLTTLKSLAIIDEDTEFSKEQLEIATLKMKMIRLKKAIEIMDSALKKIEILTTYGDSVYAAAGLPVPHAEIAKEALAEAREVMGEK